VRLNYTGPAHIIPVRAITVNLFQLPGESRGDRQTWPTPTSDHWKAVPSKKERKNKKKTREKKNRRRRKETTKEARKMRRKKIIKRRVSPRHLSLSPCHPPPLPPPPLSQGLTIRRHASPRSLWPIREISPDATCARVPDPTHLMLFTAILTIGPDEIRPRARA
jgi:hypothetical protein